MNKFLTIRRDPKLGAFVIRLEGGDDRIVIVESQDDAKRIARGIQAWTQLDVLDLT